MSNGDKIIKGMKDAVAFARGENVDVKITTFTECPKDFLPPQDHKKTMQDLLKKNSLDIKRERKLETVPISEIDEILFQIDFAMDYSIAYKAIGLTPRNYRDDKKRGYARKSTKYALLGLFYEDNLNSKHIFTETELGIIFSALTHHIQTRSEPYKQEVRDLRRIIQNLIMEF